MVTDPDGWKRVSVADIGRLRKTVGEGQTETEVVVSPAPHTRPMEGREERQRLTATRTGRFREGETTCRAGELYA